MKNSKNNIVIFLFFSAFLSASFAVNSKKPFINEELREKYPYSMITPDYGIITEFDLAQDANTYNLSPYTPQDIQTVSYWQCVPPWSITNKYHDTKRIAAHH